MNLDAPNVGFVIAAYAVAVIALVGLAFSVFRSYFKSTDES